MDERVEEIRRRRVPGNRLSANPTEWPCEDVTYLLTALAQAERMIAELDRLKNDAIRRTPGRSGDDL